MAITSKSSQEFVPIKEIRDGVVVLKDGSLRIIIMVSSINVALKSIDEQKAILLQFQSFLNSLDFSVQIFIQSRKLDIRPYIALLEEQKKKQSTDLMKIQIIEYINFITKFTESTNIMTKTFFVVVPYAPVSIGGDRGGFLSKILPGVGKKKSSEEKLASFEENRTQLEQRVAVVKQGLAGTGVRGMELGTEELVELFFKIFNPGEQEKPILPSEADQIQENVKIKTKSQ